MLNPVKHLSQAHGFALSCASVQHLVAHVVQWVHQAQFASESLLHFKEELVCLILAQVCGVRTTIPGWCSVIPQYCRELCVFF